MTDLAIELGRLPTLAEMQKLEAKIAMDAAYYYGSFDGLRQAVAGKLYGHSALTSPTDLAPCERHLSPEAQEAARKRRLSQYEKRCAELRVSTTVEVEVSSAPKRHIIMEQSDTTQRTSVVAGKRTPVWSVPTVIQSTTTNARKTKVVTEKMAKNPRFSVQDCIDAVQAAYASCGRSDHHLSLLEYEKYAETHNVPAMQTVCRILGGVRVWEKYLTNEALAKPEETEGLQEEPVMTESTDNVKLEPASPEPTDTAGDASETAPEIRVQVSKVAIEPATGSTPEVAAETTAEPAIETAADAAMAADPAVVNLELQLGGRTLKVRIELQ